MMTSYFFGPYHRDPRAVAISRTVPKGWEGHRYKHLAPSSELLMGYKEGRLTQEAYAKEYRRQLLGMRPEKIVAAMRGVVGDEPIWMCWCRPPKNGELFCHRRIWADYIRETTGERVPEAPAKGPLVSDYMLNKYRQARLGHEEG